jgi:hypothetical protein
MTTKESVPFAIADLECRIAFEELETAFESNDPAQMSAAAAAWWAAYKVRLEAS